MAGRRHRAPTVVDVGGGSGTRAVPLAIGRLPGDRRRLVGGRPGDPASPGAGRRGRRPGHRCAGRRRRAGRRWFRPAGRPGAVPPPARERWTIRRPRSRRSRLPSVRAVRSRCWSLGGWAPSAVRRWPDGSSQAPGDAGRSGRPVRRRRIRCAGGTTPHDIGDCWPSRLDRRIGDRSRRAVRPVPGAARQAIPGSDAGLAGLETGRRGPPGAAQIAADLHIVAGRPPPTPARRSPTRRIRAAHPSRIRRRR